MTIGTATCGWGPLKEAVSAQESLSRVWNGDKGLCGRNETEQWALIFWSGPLFFARNHPGVTQQPPLPYISMGTFSLDGNRFITRLTYYRASNVQNKMKRQKFSKLRFSSTIFFNRNSFVQVSVLLTCWSTTQSTYNSKFELPWFYAFPWVKHAHRRPYY